MAHATFEQLTDYIDGRLAPDDVAEVEAHLASGCAACQTNLDWLRQTVGLMGTDTWEAPSPAISEAVRQMFPSPPAPVPASSGQATIPAWIWLAGVILFILLIVALLFFQGRNPEGPVISPTATGTATLTPVTPTRTESVATAVPPSTTPTSTNIPPTETPDPTSTATSSATPTETATATATPTVTYTPTAIVPTATIPPPPPPTSEPVPSPGDDDDDDDDDDEDDDDDDDDDDD